MKTAAFLICSLAAMPALAGFLAPLQNVKLGYGQNAATVTFAADSPITKAKALCDCTTLSIQGNKLIAQVDTSQFDQNVDKQIDAATADGKSTRLTMRFEVPAAITFNARSFIWQQGVPATQQTLRISLPKGSPVGNVTEAALAGDAFDYVPQKGKNSREFIVAITPKSTSKRVLNRLVIKTDSPDPRYAQYIIYLQVRAKR